MDRPNRPVCEPFCGAAGGLGLWLLDTDTVGVADDDRERVDVNDRVTEMLDVYEAELLSDGGDGQYGPHS